jgi:hypothetical protein
MLGIRRDRDEWRMLELEGQAVVIVGEKKDEYVSIKR